MKTFLVNRANQWPPVAEYLLTVATNDPSPESETVRYSKDEAEAMARSLAADPTEAMSHSALVVYRGVMALSLVMTREPSSLHLSMSQVVPGTGRLEKLPDRVAQEAAQALLGVCEERQEGVMPTVRHFYRTLA